jgi:predicted nucleic acid-binding protein
VGKMNYLIDTNILIYYFNGLIKDKKIDEILKNSFNISIITKIEFLSWDILKDNESLREKAKEFILNANVFNLDNEIANKTIKIKQKEKIKMPDAIIGATAIVNNFKLLTNNVKDFKKMDLEITSVDLF